MRIIFAGSPSFAVPYLKYILSTNSEVVGVITQTDKPRGRGYKILPTPVKEFAISSNLPIFEVEKFDDETVNKIENLFPDLMIVVAYGKILPEKIINIPKLGCINVHFSLLPKLRGAAPVQRAIMSGEKTTGVSIIFVTKELDAGDIILQKEVEILPDDDAGILFSRLSSEGLSLLRKVIHMFSEGKVTSYPQKGEITWAPPIRKEETRINWEDSSFKINCKIRGLSPLPGAFSYFREKICKIFKAKIIDDKIIYHPGEILEVKSEIKVGTKSGILVVEEIQPEGRKKLTVQEFISGYRPTQGERFF